MLAGEGKGEERGGGGGDTKVCLHVCLLLRPVRGGSIGEKSQAEVQFSMAPC